MKNKIDTLIDKHWQSMAYQKTDIDSCVDEQIQYCGAIQNLACLFVVDHKSKHIEACSENTKVWFEHNAEQLVGKSFEAFFKPKTSFKFEIDSLSSPLDSQRLILDFLPTGESFEAEYKQLKNLLYISFEKKEAHELQNSVTFITKLKKLIAKMDVKRKLPEVLEEVTKELKGLYGFDRVMVYKFSPEWNGEVIAESKNDELETYKGLVFPASDIPKQARDIYKKVSYRMIADTELLPVSIITKKGLGKSEVDLTYSPYRASSPIHIEYLSNMGVRASFSTGIMVDNKLWGLISCHHYNSPKHLTKDSRSSFELASQMIATKIADNYSFKRVKLKNKLYKLTQELVETVSAGSSSIEAFEKHEQSMLHLTHSKGCYINIEGNELFLGDMPARDNIKRVRNFLRPKSELALWSTSQTSKDLKINDMKMAGILAIPLSVGFEDCIIWFRPEEKMSVCWAGQPKKDEARLSPRKSFDKWTEIVEGKSSAWSVSDTESAQYLLFTFVKGIFKKAGELARTNESLEKATQAKDEFISLVSHELRTPLGIIMSWGDILKDMVEENSKLTPAIDIINRNARTQVELINDLLDISRISTGKLRLNIDNSVDVANVIYEVTRDIAVTSDAKKITISKTIPNTPIIGSVDPNRLRQIIWNLLTNAVKYTNRGGSIRISLEKVDSSFEIKVIDNGKGLTREQQQDIFDKFKQYYQDSSGRKSGLGLGLSITKSLVELHGGIITAYSEGPDKGSIFTVAIPFFSIKSEKEDEKLLLEKPKTVQKILSGLNILVAEDQEEAAMALEYVLKLYGAKPTTALNGKEAYEKFKNYSFDLILSDIGMPKWDGYKLIENIRRLEKERGQDKTPAIALTAYATSDDRARCLVKGFQNHIAKPIDRKELIATIASIGLLEIDSIQS